MTRAGLTAGGGLVLLVALAYVLFPVAVSTPGAGVLQPVFEEVVRVIPPADAMIAAVYVTRGQRIEEGAPLLGFVAWPDWAVHSHFEPTVPGKPAPVAAPPDWQRETEARRLARAEAANRWQRRLYASLQGVPAPRPAEWEFSLSSRLAEMAVLDGDVALKELWAAERVRRGWHDDNKVHAFDQAAGLFRPVEHGQSYPSPASGLVVSLWATPLLQILPGRPVAEIMRDGAPVEVLGLVPAGAAVDTAPPASLTRLEPIGLVAAPPAALTALAVGRGALSEDEARELFPELVMRGRTIFVRLRLAGPVAPAALGRVVQFELTNARRPRVWLWLRDALGSR